MGIGHRASPIIVGAALFAWGLTRCSPFSAVPDGAGTNTITDAGAAVDAAADAGGFGEAGSCGDLTSPRNCGRCGRDCGNGACAGGQCAPYPIAIGQNAPFYITLDDTYAYWSSWRDDQMVGIGDGTIQRTKKTGGAVVELVVTNGDALDLVPVGDKIVFTSYAPTTGNPGVFMAPKTGGSAASLDTSGTGVNVISDTSNGVYASIRTGSDCRIVAIQPGGADTTVTVLPKGNGIEGLALSNGLIYHVDQDVKLVGRVQIDGGAPQPTWVTTQPNPELVIAAGDDVIWTCTGDGVFSKSQSTGATDSLLKANMGHGGITADDNAVYAVVENEGRVVRIDRATKATVDVATKLMDPVGITSDADAIYFLERKTGTVYRMVK